MTKVHRIKGKKSKIGTALRHISDGSLKEAAVVRRVNGPKGGLRTLAALDYQRKVNHA